MLRSLVGSEMCIRDRHVRRLHGRWRPSLSSWGATSTPLDQGLPVLRHDNITGSWVCFSVGRSSRPNQTRAGKSERVKPSEQPGHVKSCPFCTGSEHLTPPAMLTLPGDHSPWALRVVPNKFPAVRPPGEHSDSDFSDAQIDAVGHHDVVVEDPSHNMVLGMAGPSKIQEVVEAWHARARLYAAELEQSDSAHSGYITCFKNSGATAGASLLHPHSQIVALPVCPDAATVTVNHAKDWFERDGVSAFDEELEQVLSSERLVVAMNEHVVAYVPFAALSPFYLRIIPLVALAHFHESSLELREGFAQVLHSCLNRLHLSLDEPDFNLVVRSAPVGGRRQSMYNVDAYYRWHATIFPRLGSGAMAGFEFGTGIFSNSNNPCDDAAVLRDVDPSWGV
eukprot:TRINITY_DN23708_c0_g1_i1.p1 TRINITY_DN23708_c0_g1~~TRINITY_DN23708_c0_g1_i1.p1  ORF type:complete len:447 (+),score=102.91 TRINITY_DN23708_c0_g1_i1:162-1343(+)